MSAENDERLPLVLVVEDARSYRLLLRRLLGGDVRIVEADNSLEALQVLHEQDPADPVRLVVADDLMPGMYGVELLKVVGQHWPNIARVLLSGYTTGAQVMTLPFCVVDKDRPDWLIRDVIVNLAHGREPNP